MINNSGEAFSLLFSILSKYCYGVIKVRCVTVLYYKWPTFTVKFRCQSENGIQNTNYLLTHINIIIFYKQSLDTLSLKGKCSNISVNGRERDRQTDGETERQMDEWTDKEWRRERVCVKGKR